MTVAIGNLTAQWISSGINYNAIGINVNASSYGANSRLLSLKFNNSEKFAIDFRGNVLIGQSIRDAEGSYGVSGYVMTNENGNTVWRGVSAPSAIGAFLQANNATTTAGAAFGSANNATLTAGAAFNKANAANLSAASAFGLANNVNVNARSAFSQANTALTTAQAAFAAANSANLTVITTVFNLANIANATAISAFNKANTALQNTTGVLAGTLTVTQNVQLGSATSQFKRSDGIDYTAVLTGTNKVSTNYLLTIQDAGKLVAMNSSVNRIITIPSNTQVAFPINTRVDVMRLGTGNVTININTDTLRSTNSQMNLSYQYSAASLIKTDFTEWIIIGDTTN